MTHRLQAVEHSLVLESINARAYCSSTSKSCEPIMIAQRQKKKIQNEECRIYCNVNAIFAVDRAERICLNEQLDFMVK